MNGGFFYFGGFVVRQGINWTSILLIERINGPFSLFWGVLGSTLSVPFASYTLVLASLGFSSASGFCTTLAKR